MTTLPINTIFGLFYSVKDDRIYPVSCRTSIKVYCCHRFSGYGTVLKEIDDLFGFFGDFRSYLMICMKTIMILAKVQ